jgi:hypothetical protein
LLLVDHSIFNNNFAYWSGGAIYGAYPGWFEITNCTFFNNACDYQWGGAIYFENNSIITNNIFDNNDSYNYGSSSDHIYGSYTATYNDFYNPSTLPDNSGTGNITSNPQFVDYDSFELDISSPCIDAGDPSFPLDPDGTVIDMGVNYFHQQIDKIEITSFTENSIYLTETIDLFMTVETNRETFVSGVADSIILSSVNSLGSFSVVTEDNSIYSATYTPSATGIDTLAAYYSGAVVQNSDSIAVSILTHYTGERCYVDTSGDDYLGNGDQTTPFNSIYRAFRAVDAGDTIAIQPGAYYETSSQPVKGFTLFSPEGPDSVDIFVLGSWTFQDTATSNISFNEITIHNSSLSVTGYNLVNFKGTTLNSTSLTSSQCDTINLENSEFYSCDLNISADFLSTKSNMFAGYGNITISTENYISRSDSVMYWNNYFFDGNTQILGLTYMYNSQPLTSTYNSYHIFIDSSSFVENSNSALYIQNSDSLTIANSSFTLNSGSQGAGINLQVNNYSKLVNLIGVQNNSSGDGGFVYINECPFVTIDSVIAVNNHSEAEGGAVYIRESEIHMNKSNIVYNSSQGLGGGIYLDNSIQFPLMENSIIWGNTASGYDNQVSLENGVMAVRFCDIQGRWEGEGNIDDDPEFIDVLNYNFQLKSTSPCINAGNPISSLDPDSSTTDIGRFHYPMGEFEDEFYITSIVDYPEDNGKKVIVTWNRNIYDGISYLYDVTHYSIWRMDRTLSKTTSAYGWISGMPSLYRSGGWEYIGVTPAHKLESYSFVCPTLYDSTESGIVYTEIFVSAHTHNPFIYFDTPSDSGYSVDNLSPSVPTGFMAKLNDLGQVELTWNMNSEEDLNYYSIYRGTNTYFNPSQLPLFNTIDTFFVDIGQGDIPKYYYGISATDFNGQKSEISEPVEVSFIPQKFSLKQNYPNPFNPITTILFDLPEQSHITIVIYDMLGRQVRTLINQTQEGGFKSVIWNSTNDYGKPVSAGVYLYQIQAGEFVQTKKMVLLK